MNNSPATRKKLITILLVAAGIIAAVGATGYGTVALLRQVKAPTITNSSQSTTQQTKPAASPAQAKTTADAAMARGHDKAASGNQKDALADYQTAYDNYVAAGDTHGAQNAQFIITSIKAVLEAPTNPGKPKGTETSSKK